jgi:hypothetical protein
MKEVFAPKRRWNSTSVESQKAALLRHQIYKLIDSHSTSLQLDLYNILQNNIMSENSSGFLDRVAVKRRPEFGERTSSC